MPTTITTPNMDLVLPIPLVEIGPQWAIDLNAALTLVDSHDHTPGKGVPIPAAGVNVNADLPINSNNVTVVNSIGFALTASAPIGTNSIYFINGSPYYNDKFGTPTPFAGVAVVPRQEVPTGTVNGVNVTFILAHTPSSNAAVRLYQDGLILIQGVDYTVSSATITMAVAPNFAQTIYADYF